MEPTTREVAFDDVSVSVLVVETVAEATDRDPTAFEDALDEAVDPNALDALFRTGSFEGSVTFRYASHEVTVERTEEGTGRITVR